MAKLKTDVKLDEAIAIVAAYQEAAEEEGVKLDILGVGGDKPLVFANWYLAEYAHHMRASKGRYPEEAGKGAERFSVSSWSIWDLDRFPWPFEDKRFDIIWCADLLDITNYPMKVLKELSRIGKCGYVRCTHRNFESSYNVESSEYAGFEDHQWFIEPTKEGLKFLKREPKLPINLVPEFTGDREIGAWWTGEILGHVIYNGRAWEKDMHNYMVETKKQKYPHDYKEMY